MKNPLTACMAYSIAKDPCREVLKEIFESALYGSTDRKFGPYRTPYLTDLQIKRLEDLGYTVNITTEMLCDEDHYGHDIPGTEHKEYSYRVFW